MVEVVVALVVGLGVGCTENEVQVLQAAAVAVVVHQEIRQDVHLGQESLESNLWLTRMKKMRDLMGRLPSGSVYYGLRGPDGLNARCESNGDCGHSGVGVEGDRNYVTLVSEYLAHYTSLVGTGWNKGGCCRANSGGSGKLLGGGGNIGGVCGNCDEVGDINGIIVVTSG